jgi:type IV secretion system protein VirB10
MLITGVSSDIPGDIKGQVIRNVYDSRTQRVLLVPRGSFLVGRYDSQIAAGQSRLVVAWTRLQFPDGRSLALPGLPGKDLQGTSGLRDRTNNHYGRVYGNALLLSVISAGAQLSQPRGAVGPYGTVVPSVGQVGAAAVGQELATVSTEMVRRNLQIKPTIELRQGSPFYVYLSRDVVLPPYGSGRP